MQNDIKLKYNILYNLNRRYFLNNELLFNCNLLIYLFNK